MKVIYLTLIALSLTGCGEGLTIEADPQIQPYVDTFLEEAARYQTELVSGHLTIKFTSEPGFLDRAKCDASARVVYIRESFWDGANDTLREILVFHELGHCLLGRDHTKNKQSLMYENIIELEDAYRANRSAFIDELFQKTDR